MRPADWRRVGGGFNGGHGDRRQHALCISTGGIGVSRLACVKATDKWPAHTWPVTYYYVAILRNSWVSIDFAGFFFKEIHGVAQVARYHTGITYYYITASSTRRKLQTGVRALLKLVGSDEKAKMHAGVRATALFPSVKDSARSTFVASRALLKARPSAHTAR